MPATELFTFTDGSSLYAMPAKNVIRIPVWEANRTLDETHLQELDRSITNVQDIQGPFSVVVYPEEGTGTQVYRIIDGQHRQEILRRRLTGTEDDFQVLCRRYEIATHDDAVGIFQRINHCKPMQYKGSTTERLHAIVAALRRRFVAERKSGHTLTALIRPGCNRPFLNTEHLEDAVKRYGIHEREDLPVQQIVEHAEQMNGFYALDPVANIPGKATQSMLSRATEYGFFLGLDPHCSWLAALRKV
jgi:hypothetical protein